MIEVSTASFLIEERCRTKGDLVLRRCFDVTVELLVLPEINTSCKKKKKSLKCSVSVGTPSPQCTYETLS